MRLGIDFFGLSIWLMSGNRESLTEAAEYLDQVINEWRRTIPSPIAPLSAERLTPMLDQLRSAIRAAIDDPVKLQAARGALEVIACWVATEATTGVELNAQLCKLRGARGNDAKQKNAADRHAEWQEEADRLWRINPRRKKDDIADAVAENCDGKVSYIKRVIRKR